MSLSNSSLTPTPLPRSVPPNSTVIPVILYVISPPWQESPSQESFCHTKPGLHISQKYFQGNRTKIARVERREKVGVGERKVSHTKDLLKKQLGDDDENVESYGILSPAPLPILMALVHIS